MYTDHEGNEFNKKEDMCQHWKTNTGRYNRNLAKGMTQEEALTAPPISKSEAGKRGRQASGWGVGDEIVLGKRNNEKGL